MRSTLVISSCSPRNCWWLSRWHCRVATTLLWLLLLTAAPFDNSCRMVADAAHSRTRYVVRREEEPKYDRSICTFSDQGRLLQVEYGMEACATRGATAAAVKLTCGNNNDTDTYDHGDNTILLVVRSRDKVHRIDDHVWLVVAGLAGDSRYMAHVLRRYCQSYRGAFGEAPTIRDVAQHVANYQHILTRLAGARPLAVTCIIAGMDCQESASSPAQLPSSPPQQQQQQQFKPKMRLFRTDPGGILEEYRYCATGKGQEQVLKALSDQYTKLLSDSSKKKGTSKSSSTSNSNERIGNSNHAVMGSFLKAAIQAFDLKGDETVDVLTLRPHRRQPATKLQTTLFLGADKQNYQKIVEQQ